MPSSKKNSLPLTLAISAILAAPAMTEMNLPWIANAEAAQDSSQAAIDAFFASQYTYDDAALLADFWGVATPWDAKLKIGGWLMQGNAAVVNQALDNARNSVSGRTTQDDLRFDAFYNNFTYDDAVLLAEFWGKPSPWEAKLKIGSMVLNGDEILVRQALNSLKSSSGLTREHERQFQAYLEKYNYNDAQLLGEFWGQPSPWEAKLKIGRLLLSGNEAAVEQALRSAQGR